MVINLHQTLTLTYKNLFIFYKSPIISFIKTFLLLVIIAIISCFLKEIKPNNVSPNGISHTGRCILNLPDAIAAASSQRLVLS